jgi:uncharacterized protein YbbK (DUF523 family)
VTLPSPAFFENLPEPTPDSQLRILMSGCLYGLSRGVDGTSYGPHDVTRLASLANVRVVPFCPEDSAFGTPRELCNIHGGDGFDVLDGRARVLTESGKDWTEPMVRAAAEMLELARSERVAMAILMDMSAACGSQVISDGHRAVPDRKYQRGPGVSAALLIRNGIPVLSQRDLRTLELLFHKLDPRHVIAPNAIDHHESQWYRDYFRER